MDFSKNLKVGRQVARKMEKDHVLVTFQANRTLRDEATRKTANLSDFLRRCLERLAESDIDKKLGKMYDNVIDDVIDEL